MGKPQFDSRLFLAYDGLKPIKYIGITVIRPNVFIFECNKEVAMRKTIGFFMAAFLLCSLTVIGQTQQPTVKFKDLQKFLPTVDLSGFTKGKPGGQTSAMMGVSTSEATLMYRKGEEEIEVKISDMAGIPFASLGAAMMGATEFENQTENGYEKSIKIQGFGGTEKVENGEYKSAEINLFVGKRFMINLQARGIGDAALLHKLIEDMNLSELAKLAQ